MALNLAFIGLGVMGFPMAGHLAKAGYSVTVFNRTTEKAKQWASSHGGLIGETPAEAAKNADIVFYCVGNDGDVRSITTGENGVISAMKAGSILIDHTTASAELASELNTVCHEAGLHFIDAPVSG